MRNFYKKAAFVVVSVFLLVLITYSESRGQTSTTLTPGSTGCPACYTEKNGVCEPNPPEEQNDNSTGKSILGSGIGSAINALSSLFGGGNFGFKISTPKCGDAPDTPLQDYRQYPSGVGVSEIPKTILPSGRTINPVPSAYTWSPVLAGRPGIRLSEQYSPDQRDPGSDASGTSRWQTSELDPKNGWRGGCGRGIFLYETIAMQNSNKESRKANGSSTGCNINKDDYGTFNNENCRVTADDLAKSTASNPKVLKPAWDDGSKQISKVFVPRIWSNDIWFSRTGCYNPEERFVNIPSFLTPGYFFGIYSNDYSQFNYFEPIYSKITDLPIDMAEAIAGLKKAKYPGPLDEPKHSRGDDMLNTSEFWRFNSKIKDETGAEHPARLSDFLIPNDRVLMRHPYCLQIGDATPGLDVAVRFFDQRTKNINRNVDDVNSLVNQGKFPVCLRRSATGMNPDVGDFIDETDNFCTPFLNTPGQQRVSRYFLSGNCWEGKSIILAPGPKDHWMPQALRAQMRAEENFVDKTATNDKLGANSPYTALNYKDGTDRITDTGSSFFWRVENNALALHPNDAPDNPVAWKIRGIWSRPGVAPSSTYAESFSKAAVQYTTIRFINMLNLPLSTPHSLKNAFNNPIDPATGDWYANTELTDEMANKCRGDENENTAKTTDYKYKPGSNCVVVTNLQTQGEYGYLDRVIDRGPFIFRKLKPTGPHDSLIQNPFSGSGFVFSFDEAAQFVRAQSGVDNTKHDRSFRLNYLPGKIVPVDYAFNPYNIYSPNGPEYDVSLLTQTGMSQFNMMGWSVPITLLKPQYYGRKYKLQQCLRLFIERWAIEGDKGNILINKNFLSRRAATADFVPDVSYCQWTANYAADSATPGATIDTPSPYVKRYDGIATKINDFITDKLADGMRSLGLDIGDTNPYPTTYPNKVPIKRPLRSEYYDYLNFNSFGVVETSDGSGCQSLNCFIASKFDLGSLFENASFLRAVGMDNAFDPKMISKWQEGQIDMAKRDCNSLVPPNYMRDAIRPFDGCKPMQGAWRLKNPIKVLLCFSGNCTVNAATDSIGLLTDNKGDADSGIFSSILDKFTDFVGGMLDKTEGVSFLATEVDKPVFSLITPVFQGLPTFALGFYYKTGNSSGDTQQDKDAATQNTNNLASNIDNVKGQVDNTVGSVKGKIDEIKDNFQPYINQFNDIKDQYDQIKSQVQQLQQLKAQAQSALSGDPVAMYKVVSQIDGTIKNVQSTVNSTSTTINNINVDPNQIGQTLNTAKGQTTSLISNTGSQITNITNQINNPSTIQKGSGSSAQAAGKIGSMNLTNGSNGPIPNTGTIHMTVMYLQYSIPKLKIIFRDNWLARMGGMRVVPYNMLSGDGDSDVDDDGSKGTATGEFEWVVNSTSPCGWPCNHGGLPQEAIDNPSIITAEFCQKHKNPFTQKEGFWNTWDICRQTGDLHYKKDNLSGLPIIQMKDTNIAGGLKLPAGKDWIDHTLTARSCQHTLISSLLGGFEDDISVNLKEVWSNSDDISLAGTKDAVTNMVATMTGSPNPFTKALTDFNVLPLLTATRVYGGFRVSQYESLVSGASNSPMGNEDKERYNRGKYNIFYSWFPNPWSFNHGMKRDYWCEFQVPYYPFAQGKKEWETLKTPIFGHGQLNSQGISGAYKALPFFYRTGPGTTAAVLSDARPKLNYYRPERIRDGCGAFAIRATWIEDKNDELSDFLVGRTPGGALIHKNRCSKWEGVLGTKYDDPKIVSWRLPRFDFEFLKSFLECTGPIRANPPAVCKLNEVAKDRNTDEAATQAAILVGTGVACAFGGGTCDDAVSALLRMMDFFTRGDTYYGGGQTPQLMSADPDLNQQNTDSNEKYLDELEQAFDGTAAEGKHGDVINAASQLLDEQLSDAATSTNNTKIDINNVLANIDPESACKSGTAGVTVDASTMDSCKSIVGEYMKEVANNTATSFNAGKFQFSMPSTDDKEVGDLACYETKSGCFHGGTKLLADDYTFSGDDDPKRKVECQMCSMQVKDFWRVKEFSVRKVKEKGGMFGNGGFLGLGWGAKEFSLYEKSTKFGINEPFGFWCSCGADNMATTRCREDLCTCDQHVFMVGRGIGNINDSKAGKKVKKNVNKQIEEADDEIEKVDNGGYGDPGSAENVERKLKLNQKKAALNQMLTDPDQFNKTSNVFSPWAICKDYGPMRRWLQCYYQARSKACPVLVREISDTEPPSNLMNNVRFGDALAFYNKETHPNKNASQSDKTGVVPVEGAGLRDGKFNQQANQVGASCSSGNATGIFGSGLNLMSKKFARWMNEEPNHLARLSVRFESAGAGFKHQDLVFQSQVRDIEAPFMEMSVPYPIDLLSRGYTPGTDVTEKAKLSKRKRETLTVLAAGDQKEVYIYKDKNLGDELAEIEARGPNFKIDIGQLLSPRIASTGKLNPKYWDLAAKFEAGLAAASNAYREAKNYHEINYPGYSGYGAAPDHKFVPANAQDGIVGPRGCDIGGWYEMMLYQARCIKFFGLNCICDYDKTFARGDSKAYALGAAGMSLKASYPVLNNPQLKLKNVISLEQKYERDQGSAALTPAQKQQQSEAQTQIDMLLNTSLDMPVYEKTFDQSSYELAKNTANGISVRTIQKSFPLMDRGTIGPEFALGVAPGYNSGPANRPQFRLWDKGSSYKGLDHVLVGDILIYDESLMYKDAFIGGNGIDAGYPRHIAYVEKVLREPKCKGIPATKEVNPLDNPVTGCVDANPNAGRPIGIVVAEMNWGKNLDSCGVTDTWGITTKRTIMRPEELDKDLSVRIQNYASCQNADWAVCEERLWDKVHLYRPYTIDDNKVATADPAYPLCSAGAVEKPKQLSFSVISKRLGLNGLTDAQFKNGLAPVPGNVKDTIEDYDNHLGGSTSRTGNWWLYYIRDDFETYDLRDVIKMIKQSSDTIGVCDPDPRDRTNFDDVYKDYLSAKDYLTSNGL